MVKTIDLKFDGYWREVNKSSIPKKSGVYATYVCKYNEPKEEGSRGTVSLKKLIYIGEAEDVNDRVSKHEKWGDWRKQVPEELTLCFSFAPVESPDRERAECALINHHKPKCNDECKASFPYEDTTINSSGEHEFIESSVTVRKTA